MSEAIDAVRRGFVGLARGEFEMPTRTALRDGQFLVMSAHHRHTASAMIKTLSLNFDRKPAITGTVVWSELGRLDHLVADAGTVTALRTGAAVGVATDLLARPDAGALTLIGAGGQAPDQVRAVHAVRPLYRLTVVDTDRRRAETLVEKLAPELAGVELLTSTDTVAAVRGAEIICCATNATSPLFPESALPAQAHVNAIGAYRPGAVALGEEAASGMPPVATTTRSGCSAWTSSASAYVPSRRSTRGACTRGSASRRSGSGRGGGDWTPRA